MHSPQHQEWLNKLARRQRRKNWLLSGGSAIFVALGLVATFSGEWLLGAVVTLFFGTCLFVGVKELFGGDDPRWELALLIATVIMGVACAGMFVAVWTGQMDPRGGRLANLIISAVGAVFFGGGGLAAIIITTRRKR